jgi:hypothetical protein
MVLHGTIQNGVVVLDEPVELPEGAAVRVEVLADAEANFHRTVSAELDRVAGLQPNWDAQGARRIDATLIAAARSFAAELPFDRIDPPKVVPMAKGNLQFEWHDGERTLELEFEAPRTVHYLKWDSDESIEDEGFFEVGETERAEELIRWFLQGVAHV